MQKEYMEYYSKFDEEQRLLSQNITRVEFDTTVNKLNPYIHVGAKLTELGAATGRYSLYYAQKELEVTAVELVPELVSQLVANSNSKSIDLQVHESDATDVGFIPGNSQDIVLILGPLYHIQSKPDREKVLAEAQRILKVGGIVAIAYISRFFIAGLLAKMSDQLVSADTLSELYETGIVSTPHVDQFFRTAYFATPTEIEELTAQFHFKIENHIATDGFVRYIGDSINALSESQYQYWLHHHLKTCAEPSLLGSSNHGLVIAKKCC